MKRPVFGSSGIRAIVDGEFLELAHRVGRAVGRVYRSVLVGCDTRTSSDAVRYAFISGLLSAGARAWDAGTVPTPVLAYAARTFDAGAMITASHNPPEYNGIKLFNPDGSAFDSAQRERIVELAEEDGPASVAWHQMGQLQEYPAALPRYRQRLLEELAAPLGVKVVVDCGCGATSLVTPYVLQELGCTVVGLDCYPSGHFPRGIEPIQENLSTLVQVVRATGANLGVAHDADGDRLTVVDEEGKVVAGDKLLVLLARHLEAKKLVTNVDVSQVVEEMGFEVVRTRVGDIYISEELRKGGEFGGEPAGAFIFPRLCLCPDGIYAAAKVAEIASEGKLSRLVDNIPSYPLLRGSIPGHWRAVKGLEEALQPLGAVSTVDGIRVTVDDGWLLVRPSGTEPKIRITAEARTETKARELYDLAAALVGRHLEH